MRATEKEVAWLLVLFAVLFVTWGVSTFVEGQVDPDDDPLVECIDPAPDCEYGRYLVCHKGKWYCTADRKVFELSRFEQCKLVCIPTPWGVECTRYCNGSPS